jgi:large subunit ribosomal protein L24
MAVRKGAHPKQGAQVKKGGHVKKGDKVVVIAGADRAADEPREVLQVDRERGRVVVQGVNMRWKHLRRSPQNPQGGRVQRESPIHISNVLLHSEKAGKGVRTRVEVVDGKRVRVGIPCGTRFD